MCRVALAGLISSSVLAADQQTLPKSEPFDGVFPAVEGTGTLTVAGKDVWVRTTYQDGERPYLSAYDDSGQVLPDGQYRFEYKSLQKSSANAGTSLAIKTSTQGETVQGQFRISGAEIIFE
jgi:hypothetical protein